MQQVLFMEEEKRKVKVSSEESLKCQNKMHWERFKAALEGVVDTASHERKSENERSGDVHLSAKKNDAERHPHGADRISSLKRRQRGVGRHDKKLLGNEAPFGAALQIIQNRFIGFGDSFYDVVHFKRPDRICGSFAFVLKLAGLVKIAHNRRGGESCLAQAKRSVMRGGGLGINGLFFDDHSGFLHVSE